MSKNAYTIIELLVTITIIAVLVSIIVPALTSARESARATLCKMNQRQWYQALTVYASLNNDEIPRRGQGVNILGKIDRQQDWFNALPVCLKFMSYYQRYQQNIMPREKDNDIFICPSAVKKEDYPGEYFLPLAMNMYLSPWIRPRPHRITEIRHPGTMAFMADSWGPYSSVLPSTKGYDVADRHNGKANVILFDGHVSSYYGEEIGCEVGEIAQSPVRWDTKTSGVNQIFH